VLFDARMPRRSRIEALARVARSSGRSCALPGTPSVRRLALSWNVPQIWQALTEDSERPQASLNAAPVQCSRGVTTHDYFRSLTHTEARCWMPPRNGWPFGEIVRAVVR